MIGTPAELGAAVHAARIAAGLTQAEAAEKSAVSRRWFIELERGHSNAQIGKILHVLGVLGYAVELVPTNSPANNELDDLTEGFLK